MVMSEQTSNPTHLINDLQDVKDQTYKRAWQWGAIYYISRATIIICSALVSATALTQLSAPSWWQPLCALVVTVLTALDSWLKPGAAYAAYYLANDEYEALLRQVLGKETLDSNEKRYAEITARLRAAITPPKT